VWFYAGHLAIHTWGAAIVIWGSMKQEMDKMMISQSAWHEDNVNKAALCLEVLPAMLSKDDFAVLSQCMAVRRLYL
jgi:hypothetical protein